MTTTHNPDWDPRAAEVVCDQRAAYDKMRENCPVAYSQLMGWSIFRHADVMRVLQDHKTFSNAVSEHLSAPGGMDPPEHTAYRTIIDRYFTTERMAAFEPVCRDIVVNLLEEAIQVQQVELVDAFALPFAARAQCDFLGWPSNLHEELIRWTRKNHAATFAQDRHAMSDIAREFESLIDELLEMRLRARARPEDDVMASLMHEKVWGRPLSNEEIASILRNWTVGEIGTLAAAVGILVEYLASHADIESQLRSNPSLLPSAIDEILRIHGPLVASRRITTQLVEIGGRRIDAGERISLNWVSANRDGRVFNEPDRFCLDRDPRKNLLYGAGLHVCPGAPLARLELRICLEELLNRTVEIRRSRENRPTMSVYPASGFAQLPLEVRRRAG